MLFFETDGQLFRSASPLQVSRHFVVPFQPIDSSISPSSFYEHPETTWVELRKANPNDVNFLAKTKKIVKIRTTLRRLPRSFFRFERYSSADSDMNRWGMSA
jgi:hypothetical protein